MSDLPAHVEVHEEGPRDGVQIEPGPIATADKIRLIEALAETGLRHIQVASKTASRCRGSASWRRSAATTKATSRPRRSSRH